MIIDGKKIAEELRYNLKQSIEKLPDSHRPGLSVILIGEHPASQIYVKNKEKFAKEVGINSQVIKFAEDISEEELKREIIKLLSVKLRTPRQSAKLLQYTVYHRVYRWAVVVSVKGTIW